MQALSDEKNDDVNGNKIRRNDAKDSDSENDDDVSMDNGWKEESCGLRWPEDNEDFDQVKKRCRRPCHSFMNHWTYSYMGRILHKGSQQHKKGPETKNLTQDDLYYAPASMEADRVRNLFWKYYRETDGNFLLTLWYLAAPTFIPAGVCQLIALTAQICIPLLVMQLLKILESNPYQNVFVEALPYTILIFVAVLVNALANHRHHHLAYTSGVVMRVAVMSAIYDQSMRLSVAGRQGITSGQVVNLVAIDTQKLFEIMHEAHLLWSCPLAIVIVSILLIIIMGPTTILGIAVLALALPIVKSITGRMTATREKRVLYTDQRINVVTAMLQGIKVTKLNNYEAKFEKRVADVRKREMYYVYKEMAIWATTMFMTVVAPVTATTATFFVYVLVDETHILTASMTFATLLLMQALRFPIAYGGKLVGKAALGWQACRRLSHFFKREVREDGNSSTDVVDSEEPSLPKTEGPQEDGQTGQGNHELLTIKDASFVVGGYASPLGGSDSTVKKRRSQADTEEASIDDALSNQFTLSNVDLSLSRGEVVAVVGAVASGKSTLIHGLIGEAKLWRSSSSSMTNANAINDVIRGEGGVRMAYASQSPFILNATIRDNILFGRPMDRQRYEQVLDACCLRQDLALLGKSGKGDLTEIGERGVTLSGGQKQRVSIARAVYANADITLFDDPLSALDAGTSSKVFSNLFATSSKSNLLADSAVVLVTHAAHFLNKLDRIIVLHAGQSLFFGTWDELLKEEQLQQQQREEDRESTMAEHKAVLSALCNTSQHASDGPDTISEQENKKVEITLEGSSLSGDKSGATSQTKKQENPAENDEAMEGIMTVETREHGKSSIRTWLLWFLYAGGWWFVLGQVILLSLDRGMYVLIEWWVAIWTDAAYEPVQVWNRTFPAQTDGIQAQGQYTIVYSVLFVGMIVFCMARSEWAVFGGARCANRMFASITTHVLRAPMSYFDTTPLGRILNRFTYDVEIIDVNLLQAMTILMTAISWLIASQVLMALILPWMILVNVFVLILYSLFTTYYRKSAADLQRLDAVSRSPIQALLSEALDGATTIRAFNMSAFFVDKFERMLNTNSSAMMNFISAHRWLAVRIESLGATVTLAACLLVTALNERLGIAPGFVGLLIVWTSNFTITLGFLIDSISEAEAAITSVERVHSMELIPQEASMETSPNHKPPSEWPREGLLEFHNVQMRYRDGLPLAVNDLTFQVQPKQRCGVVGRTGAGKTSITTALYRLAEIEGGCITLDGVDLSKLGLKDVRGREHGMYIIPQDPVLFAGTLRNCLDPFGSSKDEDILEALQAVRFPGSINSSSSSLLSILEDRVEEGGVNYSVGERQLLCMARAFLAKPKLLVMDEATASIDGKTDDFIQRMLRERFLETTLLTIAHRLETIIDYDVILVMDKGKAAEFGSPRELLSNQDGIFTDMVNATGKENAALLRDLALGNKTRY